MARWEEMKQSLRAAAHFLRASEKHASPRELGHIDIHRAMQRDAIADMGVDLDDPDQVMAFLAGACTTGAHCGERGQQSMLWLTSSMMGRLDTLGCLVVDGELLEDPGGEAGGE